MKLHYFAEVVLHKFVAFHDESIAQAHFTTGLQTKEFRRRIFHEVAPLHPNFPCNGHFAYSHCFILRVNRSIQPQYLTFREISEGAVVEAPVAEGSPGDIYQFERTGYFVHDIVDSRPGNPVLNRIVTLRDTWARIEKEMAAGEK